jgi:dTDP-4-dehydrorhamnose 3,5-epimerase
MIVQGQLPAGAYERSLERKADDRGALTEMYRTDWSADPLVVQWNFIQTESGVMRGVRCHFRHNDHLIVLKGSLVVGLRDLRPGSPTEGRTAIVELSGDRLSLLMTPSGVAHGLYSVTPALFCVGVTCLFDDSDDNGCFWRDRDLGIDWPFQEAKVCATDGPHRRLADLLPLVPAFRS